MDGFQIELLARLPLAQAALKVFDYVFDLDALNRLFDAHRGRCYQKELSFDVLVYLIRDALVLHHGSGHRSFDDAQRAGELPVALQNVYAKLGRLPPELSMAFLAQGAHRTLELLPHSSRSGEAESRLPSLRDFHKRVIDGKKLKKIAKRLKALRGLPGKLLGGKLLVALSLESGLAVAMNADLDGERNDVPLVPGLVSQVRQMEEGPILWIADRQFAGLDVLALLGLGPDHFLVRSTKTLKLQVDPQRPVREGTNAEGRRYVEEWGWIGSGKRRRYVRRITLCRPGEEDVALMTDLLDAGAYPAEELLEAYLQRWGIERMFQQVTEVFDLQRLIGSTPQATIFQASMCFTMYNIVQVVGGYAAGDGQKRREQVSTEKLFEDVRDEMKMWAKMGDCELAGKLLPAGNNPVQVAAWLRQTLKGIWTDRWIKAPSKRRKSKPPAKVPERHGGHTSVWRVLQQARQRCAKERRS